MSKLWTPELVGGTDYEDKEKPVTKPNLGPPKHTPGWLRNLEVNTLFLCKDTTAHGCSLHSYHLINKTNLSALLYNQEVKLWWVDIDEFSDIFKLQEILGKVEDVEDTGAVQQGPVENNANA